MVYLILAVCIASTFAFFRWQRLRKLPEDHYEIESFARGHAIRIISVKRSSAWPYWSRGILVSLDARIYAVAAEDAQGAPADIGVMFDPWFSTGQLEVLEPYGLAVAAPAQSVNFNELAASPTWRWSERVPLFCLGACISGFLFCAGMRDLAYPERPKVPDIAHGFTNLLTSARYGPVYVTQFEYWAGTYGSKLSLGCATIISLLVAYLFKIRRTGTTFVVQVLVAGAISYALYDLIWRVG